MSDTTLPTLSVEHEITILAKRYKAADSVGLQVLNLIGGQAESLLDRLPKAARGQLETATTKALEVAMRAAQGSRQVVPDQKPWLNTALATAMGAAGGVGGLPSALAELPVTVTVLLRSIQGIAAEYGHDPADPEVARHCLTVLASAGPLARDDGADLGFLSARMTLTGATVHGLVAKVAPRLATVLGQKLATQTVPVLGAAAGAATNYAYTSYYQQMAHVHFGLLELSRRSGLPHQALLADLEASLKSR